MTNSIAPPMTNAKIRPVYPVGTELVSLVVVVIAVDSLGVLIGGVVVEVEDIDEVVEDDVELTDLSMKKESKRDPSSKYADTATWVLLTSTLQKLYSDAATSPSCHTAELSLYACSGAPPPPATTK